MADVEAGSDGSRRIVLFIPYEVAGKKIAAVEFRAFTFGDTNAWQSGLISGPLQLMSQLTGLSATELDALRYPDADRVMNEFMAHIPTQIRRSISEGDVPIPPAVEDEATAAGVEQEPAPGYTELNEPHDRPTPAGQHPPGPNWPYPEPDHMPPGEGSDVGSLPGVGIGMDLRDGGERNRGQT